MHLEQINASFYFSILQINVFSCYLTGFILSRIPGQPQLDDQYRSACFSIFLKTMQSPKPSNTDDLFYCMVWIIFVSYIMCQSSMKKQSCTFSYN